tara:strand:- start:451 stop:684 length:234 start_codon:yes stop_codon:yes gene_type:complete
MDAFAQGLKIAAKIRKDGRLADCVRERYQSWDSNMGQKIAAGGLDFKELETYALNHDEPSLTSGRQEMLEGIFNSYF